MILSGRPALGSEKLLTNQNVFSVFLGSILRKALQKIPGYTQKAALSKHDMESSEIVRSQPSLVSCARCLLVSIGRSYSDKVGKAIRINTDAAGPSCCTSSGNV